MAAKDMRTQAKENLDAQSAQKRRDRMISVIGAVVVAVVVIGVITAAVVTKNKKQDVSAAKVPAGVSKVDYGVSFGNPKPGAPTVELFEDFQCPACAAFEPGNGSRLVDWAKQGKIKLVWHPAAFLDDAKAAENQAAGNPQSSKRATAAWGCAIDAGVAAEYHEIVFKNQPQQEGQGYSDITLLTLGSQVVPRSKVKAFADCVSNGTYRDWAAASAAYFNQRGVTSTPTVFINGKEQKSAILFEPTGKQLLSAIEAATKKS